MNRLLDEVEQLKASVRAKAEHPFRVVKQQFGYAKVRYRRLAKNTTRLPMCDRWAAPPGLPRAARRHLV